MHCIMERIILDDKGNNQYSVLEKRRGVYKILYKVHILAINLFGVLCDKYNCVYDISSIPYKLEGNSIKNQQLLINIFKGNTIQLNATFILNLKWW